MRQVVVLEPAGSVLVIRQTSLGNNGGNVGTNSTGTNDTHALVNHAAVPTIASNDHNQNRIVVVRSSTSSTMTNSADNHASTNNNINVNANINGNPGGISCKSSPKVGIGGGVCKRNERNDHLRNEYKSQDANSNEMNPAAGCRPRTCKEAAHENVASDRKLDGADPISDGDPIKLPENLETLPRAEHFPTQRHRWNTNEILLDYLKYRESKGRRCYFSVSPERTKFLVTILATSMCAAARSRAGVCSRGARATHTRTLHT